MTALEILLNSARSVLAFLNQRSERRTAAMDAAWKSLRAAVTATRVYLADQAASEDRPDRDREERLAELWNSVGMAVSAVGGQEARELRDRCFQKADYWTDPARWSEGDVKAADISLESVERAIARALDGEDGGR